MSGRGPINIIELRGRIDPEAFWQNVNANLIIYRGDNLRKVVGPCRTPTIDVVHRPERDSASHSRAQPAIW